MKQSWVDKLERKMNGACIHGLMKYIVGIELLGALIGVFFPGVYSNYFMLDFNAIAHGQVWRLVTFVLFPEITQASFSMMNILFFAIQVYLYYMIGNSLENVWGAFRFNVYYLSGILFSVIAGLVTFAFTGMPWPVGLQYVNQALFLAFATIFPDMEFLLFFILPVKAKWLGILYAAFMAYDVFMLVTSGNLYGYISAIAIVISMLNFLVLFLSTRNFRKYSPVERKRRADFKRETGPKVVPLYRHRCAICGRTEKDGDDLEFRFCSKCDGNYEYCQDHIFTHEHVHK